jgi:hypothetical protein
VGLTLVWCGRCVGGPFQAALFAGLSPDPQHSDVKIDIKLIAPPL